MFKTFLKWLSIWSLGLILSDAMAQQQSLGHIADSLRASTVGAVGIVHAICLVVGIGLLMTAFLKFRERRDNPDEVPLRTPILITLLGIAFIALSFLPMPKLG